MSTQLTGIALSCGYVCEVFEVVLLSCVKRLHVHHRKGFFYCLFQKHLIDVLSIIR